MEIHFFIVYTLLVIQFVFLILLLTRQSKKKEDSNTTQLIEAFTQFTSRLDRHDSFLKDEFTRNREESNKAAQQSRIELSNSFSTFTQTIDTKIAMLYKGQTETAKDTRAELTLALDKVRTTVEKQLSELQKGNEEKLEKMRETVDEKLHKTLETRLGESFKLVSDRLEQVQKGLGEMQNLATGVGDLKKVLSNVKTKGVLGEYQLAAILEQVLTPSQYEQNVKVHSAAREFVEFAVKIPSKSDSSKHIWLPIDAKFPSETYERLNTAYENADLVDIEQAKKELERTIKIFAKDIATKYILPPHTTDFAIMFLPFEGLYAEVLRIPGLFESLQRDFKITITGPTTISAFLSSLQMGFRTLAVEKRTSEIWELLGAVRTEFGKFGDVLQKTKDKLDSASKEIETAGVRSRAIERKLKDVQELPETLATKLLDS